MLKDIISVLLTLEQELFQKGLIMITGREIGLVLGAISQIYTVGKVAWKFYKTTQQFGQDFKTSIEDFHIQEWVFGSHLDLFNAALQAHPQTDTKNERRQKSIANLINQLIDIFNATYDIVKQYETQCSYMFIFWDLLSILFLTSY